MLERLSSSHTSGLRPQRPQNARAQTRFLKRSERVSSFQTVGKFCIIVTAVAGLVRLWYSQRSTKNWTAPLRLLDSGMEQWWMDANGVVGSS